MCAASLLQEHGAYKDWKNGQRAVGVTESASGRPAQYIGLLCAVSPACYASAEAPTVASAAVLLLGYT